MNEIIVLIEKNAEVEINYGTKPFVHPPKHHLSIAVADPQNTTLKGAGALQEGRSPLALILEPSRCLLKRLLDIIHSQGISAANS